MNEDRSVITLEAAYTSGGLDVGYGTYVQIILPYELSGTYQWTCDGQSGYVGLVTENGKTGLFFYAPHFSTYVLTKTPDTTPDAGTSAGSGSTTSSGSAAPVIKATGADMSSTVFAVLGLGVLAAAGIAVSSKKLAK